MLNSSAFCCKLCLMTRSSISSPHLLLITQSYPFGTGETFLADEVPYLAERFVRVTVVPLYVQPGSARLMPEGWKLDLRLDHIRRTSSVAWMAPAVAVLYSQLPTMANEVHSMVEPRDLIRTGYPTIRRYLRFLRTAAWIDIWFTTMEPHSEKMVVYNYWFEAAAFGIAALKHRRVPSLICVSRAHRWDIYAPNNEMVYFPFRRFTLGLYNRVFPVSADGVQYINRLYGSSNGAYSPLNSWAENVHLARLGVEANGQCPRSTDGIIRVISCSRLQPQKRLDRLVDILCAFAQKYPTVNVVWCHLGNGPQGSYLRDYSARKLPQSVRVQWQGDVPHEEVLHILRTGPWDVFMNVSDSEGVPVSIMEALAAGIPVIATDVGGTSEIIDDHVGACLASGWDTVDAAAVMWDSTRSDRNRELRVAARQRWSVHCDARRNYRAFACGLVELCA